MGEIAICYVDSENIYKVAGLLKKEVSELSGRGLPLTVLAAVEDSVIIGALGGNLLDTCFELNSLYVDPGHRRRGAGRGLINKLEELLKGEVWEIRVGYTLENEDNETLRPFLNAMGFDKRRKSYPAYYMESLSRTGLGLSHLAKGKNEVHTLSEIKTGSLKLISNIFSIEGGRLSQNTDLHSSACILTEEGVLSFAVVEKIAPDMLRIPLIWWSGHARPEDVVDLTAFMLREIKKRYPPETKLAIVAGNEHTEKLIALIMRDTGPCSLNFYKVL